MEIILGLLLIALAIWLIWQLITKVLWPILKWLFHGVVTSLGLVVTLLKFAFIAALIAGFVIGFVNAVRGYFNAVNQVYGARFGKKAGNVIGRALGVVCIVLIAFVGFRVFSSIQPYLPYIQENLS